MAPEPGTPPQAECTGDAACTADHDTPTGTPRIRHTGVVMPPARECPDCRSRASGNVPNIHARHCRHHAITELRNSDRAAAARDYLADYDRLMAAPYDENALTRNHGEMSEALRFLLAEIDRQAGA